VDSVPAVPVGLDRVDVRTATPCHVDPVAVVPADDRVDDPHVAVADRIPDPDSGIPALDTQVPDRDVLHGRFVGAAHQDADRRGRVVGRAPTEDRVVVALQHDVARGDPDAGVVVFGGDGVALRSDVLGHFVHPGLGDDRARVDPPGLPAVGVGVEDLDRLRSAGGGTAHRDVVRADVVLGRPIRQRDRLGFAGLQFDGRGVEVAPLVDIERDLPVGRFVPVVADPRPHGDRLAGLDRVGHFDDLDPEPGGRLGDGDRQLRPPVQEDVRVVGVTDQRVVPRLDRPVPRRPRGDRDRQFLAGLLANCRHGGVRSGRVPDDDLPSVDGDVEVDLPRRDAELELVFAVDPDARPVEASGEGVLARIESLAPFARRRDLERQDAIPALPEGDESRFPVRVRDRKRPVLERRGQALYVRPEVDGQRFPARDIDRPAVLAVGRERVRPGIERAGERLARRERDRLGLAPVAGRRDGHGDVVGIGEEQRPVVDLEEQAPEVGTVVLRIAFALRVLVDRPLDGDVDLDGRLNGLGGRALADHLDLLNVDDLHLRQRQRPLAGATGRRLDLDDGRLLML